MVVSPNENEVVVEDDAVVDGASWWCDGDVPQLHRPAAARRPKMTKAR